MDVSDAMRGINQALKELSIARGELSNRLSAAMAFRAAVSGKAHGPDPAVTELPEGVARARRRELESSLKSLEALEASVEEARRSVARAERAWLSVRHARPGRTP